MKEKETERKCIFTGEVEETKNLLRFTLSPDKEVVPDFGKKLPGKGAYVSNSYKVLTTAIKKNLFSKAFKTKAKVDEGLCELAEKVLYKKGLNGINMARKAGALVTGFEKVSDAVKKGKVSFLVDAVDAGEDGHKRIVLMAKELKVFSLYKANDLDEALDKVNTVHIAVLKSDIAKMVKEDLERLETFLCSKSEMEMK